MAAPDASDAVMVFTTLETADAARSFVERLVDRRLVACGTVIPNGTSVYRWEGEITTANEALVLLKTTPERWPELCATVGQEHPYDVPELLVVPVTAGLPRYLAWVRQETAPEVTP